MTTVLASVAMVWRTEANGKYTTAEGYVITANRQRRGWVYLARGPLEPVESPRQARLWRGYSLSGRYALGEFPPVDLNYAGDKARIALGTFTEWHHGTADAAAQAARDICEQDHTTPFTATNRIPTQQRSSRP